MNEKNNPILWREKWAQRGFIPCLGPHSCYAAELPFFSVPHIPTLDAQAGDLSHSFSVPGAVAHGGGPRDNRPAPILMGLPSMAGSEEEFLLRKFGICRPIPEAFKAVRSPGRVQGLKEGGIGEVTGRSRLSVGRWSG